MEANLFSEREKCERGDEHDASEDSQIPTFGCDLSPFRNTLELVHKADIEEFPDLGSRSPPNRASGISTELSTASPCPILAE